MNINIAYRVFCRQKLLPLWLMLCTLTVVNEAFCVGKKLISLGATDVTLLNFVSTAESIEISKALQVTQTTLNQIKKEVAPFTALIEQESEIVTRLIKALWIEPPHQLKTDFSLNMGTSACCINSQDDMPTQWHKLMLNLQIVFLHKSYDEAGCKETQIDFRELMRSFIDDLLLYATFTEKEGDNQYQTSLKLINRLKQTDFQRTYEIAGIQTSTLQQISQHMITGIQNFIRKASDDHDKVVAIKIQKIIKSSFRPQLSLITNETNVLTIFGTALSHAADQAKEEGSEELLREKLKTLQLKMQTTIPSNPINVKQNSLLTPSKRKPSSTHLTKKRRLFFTVSVTKSKI